ncbi:hypothetical protein QF037_003674 [Streptomyces canus]|uniref:hypothetical protein n=1 Tax=Streptomyces canus TaxID=58343 RepID=UPI00278BA266|nr:hypothetical protein [Streptomyces canus]MDQ0599329.1 hypothetical protein [Streptomyces canus]
MTAAVTAMITAVVGVLGTPFAPVLSQRLTSRQRAEEAEVAERRWLFEDRRTACTAMLCLLGGTPRPPGLAAVPHPPRDRSAEAQMVVPERILEASRAVNEVLAGIDALVKRLDRGRARDGESAVRALLDLKEAEPRLSEMRRLMREDLGVAD